MPSQDIVTGESITVTCKAPTPGAAAPSGASWKNGWGLFGSSKPAAAARDTVQGEAKIAGGKRNKNKKGTKKGGMKKGGKKSKTSKRSKR
jgi:hypothetical protein